MEDKDLKLRFPPDALPLSVITTAKVAGLPISVHSDLSSGAPPALVLPTGVKLQGTNAILRYLGRISIIVHGLYKRDDLESSQIDEWLDYAPVFASGSEYLRELVNLNSA